MAEQDGAPLVRAGYFQISRKFRTVARLPEGMTGKEALASVCGKGMVRHLSEEQCTDQYLRIYATDRLELTASEFRAFLRAGGGTAL